MQVSLIQLINTFSPAGSRTLIEVASRVLGERASSANAVLLPADLVRIRAEIDALPAPRPATPTFLAAP